MDIYKIIQCFIVGWSDANLNNRNVGWSLPTQGWKGFIEHQVKPVLSKGIKRLELHNPFGCMPNISMESTQYIQARRAALYFLTEDFVSNWKPITSSGIEVIAYMGTPALDPMMIDLRSKKMNALYLNTLKNSYDTIIEAGCSVAFDAMSATTANDPDYYFMRLLQKLGIKTYIEAWPVKTFPELSDCNEFTTSQFHPEVMHQLSIDGWPIQKPKMTGERIQILTNEPYLSENPNLNWSTANQWLPRWINEVINIHDETACLGLPQEFITSKLSLDQWLHGPITT